MSVKSTINAFFTAFFRSALDEGKFLITHRWDFSVMFWLPLFTIFIVWWIFARSIIVDLPIGVIDYNHSPLSNTLIRYLDASPELAVKQLYPSADSAEQAILSRDIYAVVTIPSDFDKRIYQGVSSPISLRVNAQYGTHSGIIQKGVQTVVGTMSAGAEIKRLVKTGTNVNQAPVLYSPIQVQRISLFNTAANYQQFLGSTVIPAFLHILAMVIGATTVGRELRDKRLGDWYEYISGQKPKRLSVTPDMKVPCIHSSVDENINLKPTESNLLFLIAGLNGKFIWSMLSYTLWGAFILLLAVDIHGASNYEWWMTYLVFLLLMMLSFWMGAIFTLNTYSLRMGLSTTGFISAPSYAFAGVTFPYIAITDSAKYWADALPLTYYLKLQIAQLQMNAPPTEFLSIFYGFIIAVFCCLILSAWLTKRDLRHPERWGAR